VSVFCAQGEVIIYELPGMLVPATAQNLTGKRIARYGSLHGKTCMSCKSIDTVCSFPSRALHVGLVMHLARLHLRCTSVAVCLAGNLIPSIIFLLQHCHHVEHAALRCAMGGVAGLLTPVGCNGVTYIALCWVA